MFKQYLQQYENVCSNSICSNAIEGVSNLQWVWHLIAQTVHQCTSLTQLVYALMARSPSQWSQYCCILIIMRSDQTSYVLNSLYDINSQYYGNALLTEILLICYMPFFESFAPLPLGSVGDGCVSVHNSFFSFP